MWLNLSQFIFIGCQVSLTFWYSDDPEGKKLSRPPWCPGFINEDEPSLIPEDVDPSKYYILNIFYCMLFHRIKYASILLLETDYNNTFSSRRYHLIHFFYYLAVRFPNKISMTFIFKRYSCEKTSKITTVRSLLAIVYGLCHMVDMDPVTWSEYFPQNSVKKLYQTKTN